MSGIKFHIKWKKVVTVLILLLIGMQFIPRPPKNSVSDISTNSIDKVVDVPDSIMSILKTFCYDCHSNNTNYPWYSNIQPVSFFLNSHIVKGKEELNFDEFGSYSKRRQQSKLKSIVSQVKKEIMPLTSYKLLHNEARLSDEVRNMLIKWIEGMNNNGE